MSTDFEGRYIRLWNAANALYKAHKMASERVDPLWERLADALDLYQPEPASIRGLTPKPEPYQYKPAGDNVADRGPGGLPEPSPRFNPANFRTSHHEQITADLLARRLGKFK